MVNPLARMNMEKSINDKDKIIIKEYNPITNLGSTENKLIRNIINGDIKVTTSSSTKTLSLDEAVQIIKDRR